MAAIQRGVSDVYNVGTGRETSVNELFRQLMEIKKEDMKAE